MSNYVQDTYGMIILKPRRVGHTDAHMSQQEYESLIMDSHQVPSVMYKHKFPVIYKNGSNYSLDSKTRVYHSDFYYKNYYKLSDLTVHEQAYIKYERIQSEDTTSAVRRTGRSTRIVEAAVAELVRNGETILMDHHPLGDRFIYSHFYNIMKTQHPEIEFIVEQGQRDEPKLILITNT